MSSFEEQFGDLTREELQGWMIHQKALISHLENALEREKEKLAFAREQFGPGGRDFNPELTYRKIRRLGRLHGAALGFKEGYPEDGTWKEKLEYILTAQRFPMKSRDFVRYFKLLDRDADQPTNLNNTISVHLRNLVKDGRFVHYKQGDARVGWYVLPHWLDEAGEVKPEYWDHSPGV